ncbi:MAG: FHA domain-containing protein [Verrucomicrobiota bacterium]
MSSPRLINAETGGVFHLENDETLIGRDPDCKIVVPDISISGQHAAVLRSPDGSYNIRDLGSTNGTMVNGVRVADARLTNGCAVGVGSITFRFQSDNGEEPTRRHVNSSEGDDSQRESADYRSGVPKPRPKGLWHPVGVTLSGIPLGFAFSSVLIALNWHRLRRHGMAIFAYVFAIAYGIGVQQPLLSMFAWPWPYVMGVLVWFPFLGLPQWQYIRQHVPKPRPKRPWLRVLGIGFAFQVTIWIWNRYDQATQASPPLGAAVANPISSEHEYTTEELTNIAQNYVVEVGATWKLRHHFFFQDEGGCAGSAVLYRATPGQIYFVTNKHVVVPPVGASDYTCAVRFPDASESLKVEVLAFGKNGLDLALLRMNTAEVKETFNIRMVSWKEVIPGQSCIALGNALDSGISVTAGLVSRFDHEGNTVLIRTSAPISHGNSGGGLFRLKDGSLIGITTAMRVDGQNVNLAIPADYFAGDESWDYLPGVSK